MLHTCVHCGKKEDVPYYTSWWQGHCPPCAQLVLKDHVPQLGNTTGDEHNGAGCYDSDTDFS